MLSVVRPAASEIMLCGYYDLDNNKMQRLSTNIKLTLDQATIKSIMVRVCYIWVYAADLYLLELSGCRTDFSELLATLTGAHMYEICM
jgi:hypothetical protein